jgi:hypothetical protein
MIIFPLLSHTGEIHNVAQEKRHGVMARIRTSDLTIKRPTLYHLSHPARLMADLAFKNID